MYLIQQYMFLLHTKTYIPISIFKILVSTHTYSFVYHSHPFAVPAPNTSLVSNNIKRLSAVHALWEHSRFIVSLRSEGERGADVAVYLLLFLDKISLWLFFLFQNIFISVTS